MYMYDGQSYRTKEDAPDLGSWVCTGNDGNKRFYTGMSADVDKLPTYDDLATDSTAKCIDNGDFYYYYAPTKSWEKQ